MKMKRQSVACRVARLVLLSKLALLIICHICLLDSVFGLNGGQKPPAKSTKANLDSRRAFLAGAIVAGALPFVLDVEPAKADPMNALLPMSSGAPILPYAEGDWTPTSPKTKLGSSRISSKSSSPLQQAPFASQELYYAPFLFGAWDVKATLKQKMYPFGKDFVPSKSLIEGSPRNRNEQVGDTTSYEVHYFSTLADTLSNQITVNLGLGVPKPKIIADRAHNAISMSSAYHQLTPVKEVEWDYRADPTRLTLQFGAGPVADDMRPLGQRRGEVYLLARTSEESDDGSVYCAAERSRSVALGPGTVVVSDIETITEFQKVDSETVSAVSRVAVYLTPNPNSREGVLWQQVGGKAVAFFDYELSMKRINDEFTLANGSKVLRPCVQTPKDVIQCE
jgi:hypothetical protein